jgi:hypothetical protein
VKSAFDQIWVTIRDNLGSGQRIKAWTVANRAKTTFEILGVDQSSVYVLPERGDERRVPRSDFEKVYRVWESYKNRQINRYQLSFTQHSVYIITILHLIEGLRSDRR